MDVNELLEERTDEIIAELAPDIATLSEQLSIPTDAITYIARQLTENVIAGAEPAEMVRLSLSKAFDHRKPILVENDETGERRWAVINETGPLSTQPLLEEAEYHAHVVFERGAWGSREYAHRMVSARNRGSNFHSGVSLQQIWDHPITQEAHKRGWKISKVFYAKYKEDPEPNEAAKEHIKWGRYDDAKHAKHK